MASSSQIKPGETGSVAVMVDTSDFKSVIVKEVWLYTNDPKNQKVVLTIKAEVGGQ
jgi:hypothetical protein